MMPIGLYFWNSYSKSNARDWLIYFLMALGLTVIFFLMDCGFGNLFHPGLSACAAGAKSFGFFFTLLSEGFAAVSLSGSLRALVITWLTSRRSSE